ncbi:nicotinate-nucleotide adenylyltransferase [Streptococcaceae bacterium ESL0687]|nr:nicotinate-nucleotide adenylyltransferase [Streptococcaceae bacterium ESL0687]
MKKRVGILGGNFNPVHNAHLFMADQVKNSLGLAEVYLMPEAIPPHVDKKETIEVGHRVKMLELALENYPQLKLELVEIERGGVSYSYETMKNLLKINPDVDYFFIIGEDMVDYLPKWHKIDELIELVTFVAVRRSSPKNNQIPSKENPYPVVWVDLPYLDISSSYIREKIGQGIRPNFIIPENVLKYIEKNELYKKKVHKK